MKFILTSDWHLRATRPARRSDDWRETQRAKVQFIADYAYNNGIDHILQAGDFTDTPRQPDWLKIMVMGIFRQQPYGNAPKIYGVLGQHDVFFHQLSTENTMWGVLQQAGLLTLLGSTPVRINDTKRPVHIYGASWGQDDPDVIDPDAFNIIVMHRMIITEKLWAEQTDYVDSSDYLKRTEFDLVLSGDNHQQFTVRSGRKLLVNCGSLLRTAVDQSNHRPAFWVYDTDKKDAVRVDIPVAPGDAVFDLEGARTEKARNERLDSFVELLQGSIGNGLDFKTAVHAAAKNAGASPEVMAIINECMESSNG